MNSSQDIQKMALQLMEDLIKNDINKENLLKAGTQIELNMQRDFRKRIESRIVQLRNEFNTIDINKDAFLSIDELYNFFSSKNPSVKKEDIQSLFELTDRDKNQRITLDEFVYIYILLEEKLKLKKEEISRLKKNLMAKLEEFQDKLNNYENEEFYPQGISKQNRIEVKIIQITDLMKKRNCKVILNLMNKSGQILAQKETDTKYGINLSFKELLFYFQVKEDKCYIKCILTDPNSLINEGHSYFIINLGDYLDQMKKEQWYNISGEENMAKAQVLCSFTYNNKKKYSDLISRTSQEIDKCTQDIFQLENVMGKINEPYGLLHYNKIKEIQNKRILDISEYTNDLLANSRITIYSNMRNSKLDNSESPNKLRISDYENNINNAKNRAERLNAIPEEGGSMSSNLLRNEIKSTEGYLPENYNGYFPKHSILGKKSNQLLILGIVIALASFICGKFDVFNLLLYIFGLMMIYNVANINSRFDTVRYYFYGLLLFIAFDVFWILFLNREQNIESSLFRVIAFGLTIISLIIKIMLSYLIRNRRS